MARKARAEVDPAGPPAGTEGGGDTAETPPEAKFEAYVKLALASLAGLEGVLARDRDRLAASRLEADLMAIDAAMTRLMHRFLDQD